MQHVPPAPAFGLPMRITPFLSGNFGEIRSNHFHSGLDFKTNKRTGYPVYAVADGWISRIRISASGFGYALYLDHPSGHTSVYGHLDCFAQPFDSIAKAWQYDRKSFELDTLCTPNRIPVKAGQLIAYSGNSGSSSAPHLHFEIRDTRSEDVLDPLIWYSKRIPDKQAPRFRELTLFAIDGLGAINGGKQKLHLPTIRLSNGAWALKDTFPSAYGLLGLGIKAYDYMDNTSNIYGVWSVKLFKNDTLLFSQQMDRFAFSETRYINAMIDYKVWRNGNNGVMRSFLLPGNRWPHCFASDRGLFHLRDGEVSRFRYELKDRHGNSATLTMVLKGKTMDVTLPEREGQYMDHHRYNVWKEEGVKLDIPEGALYEDLHFTAERIDAGKHSDIIRLHDEDTPLHLAVPLSIRINNDTLTSKSAYYLAKKNKAGWWAYAGSGVYSAGWLTTSIREFGTFTVLTDTTPPKITPMDSNNAVKNRLFRIHVSDNASGIATWSGTIDGQWALFQYVARTGQLVYVFDDSRLNKKNRHNLVLTVTDACGNTGTFSHSFYY